MATKTLLFSNALFLLLLLVQKGQTWFSCDEVEYCTRVRYKEPSDAFYLEEEVSLQDGRAVFVLINSETSKRFELSLSTTEEDIVRITIDDPEYPRHRVIDALDGEPTLSKFITERTNNGYNIKAGRATVVIQATPFQVTINTDENENVVEINSKRRLVFEEQEPEVAVALDFTFPRAKRAYGLPSHPDRLPLRNTRSDGRDPYRFYNIDHAAYAPNSTQAVYGAIPVLYAFSQEQTVGVFWHNSAQTFVDIENEEEGVTSYFFSESGVIDVFVFVGPTLRDAVKQYANLTGTYFLYIMLPQKIYVIHTCLWNIPSFM